MWKMSQHSLWWNSLDVESEAFRVTKSEDPFLWNQTNATEKTRALLDENFCSRCKVYFSWNCPDCWYYPVMPHQTNGWVRIDESITWKTEHVSLQDSNIDDINTLHKPFERVKLDIKDISHRNMRNTNDGDVFLEWFETNWESIILKLAILQRTEPYEAIHVWTKWWYKWNKNGEQVKTVRRKTSTNIKNIRVHLVPDSNRKWSKKISSIYSWTKRNGVEYKRMKLTWHPIGKDPSKKSEKYWLPFEAQSMRWICMEAMKYYRSYMQQ